MADLDTFDEINRCRLAVNSAKILLNIDKISKKRYNVIITHIAVWVNFHRRETGMVAGRNTVKRDVLAHLSVKGRVGGRNPISALCNATGNHTREGKAIVEMVVSDLAREGKISVKKRRNGMIDEIIHRSARKHVDFTELSDQAKRERTFAKGVPAHLPDAWCTPVQVSYMPGKEPTSEEQSPEPESSALRYIEGASYADNLTTCLTALRQAADQNGWAEATSVRGVLLLVEGVTDSRASRAMDHLQGMGLYNTAATGFQTWSYTVDMETDRVTPEMVKEYRQRSRKAKATTNQPAEANDSTVQVVDSTSAEVKHDDVAALLEVVESLENRAQTTLEELREAQAALEAVNKQRDRLSAELNEARKEISRLRTELDTAKSQPETDPRITALLSRYGKTT